ncbi:hypothetical protein AB1Y20_003596 [Prymnesium parvum]|uniref:Uncharacterized protein n=1 Tax=Prymnesium parvum TaxID=97485 RepID=A0AB34J596_PRYPA
MRQWGFLLLAPSQALSATRPPITRGDEVRVIADVQLAGGRAAKGLYGRVVEDLREDDGESWGACCELAWGQPPLTVHLRGEGPLGYFELDELTLVHRDLRALEAFEESERRRWRQVYGEEWVARRQELLEGDRVEVTRDVRVKGVESARGMRGTVVDVWSDCETDAACCCNELTTAPVTVQLEANDETPLVGYFHEDELVRVGSE